MALNEAAQAVLVSGAATPADVSKATGLSRTELRALLRDSYEEPVALRSA